jgi:hypothetical protein
MRRRRPGHLLPVEPGDIPAEKGYGAARRRVRQAEQAQERRLAGAARADEEVEAARGEAQVDVAQHLLAGRGVARADAPQLQDDRAPVLVVHDPALTGGSAEQTRTNGCIRLDVAQL